MPAESICFHMGPGPLGPCRAGIDDGLASIFHEVKEGDCPASFDEADVDGSDQANRPAVRQLIGHLLQSHGAGGLPDVGLACRSSWTPLSGDDGS